MGRLIHQLVNLLINSLRNRLPDWVSDCLNRIDSNYQTMDVAGDVAAAAVVTAKVAHWR